MSIHLLNTGLAPWNILCQNQTAVTGKLVFTNGKTLSERTLLRIRALPPSQPVPTDQAVESTQRMLCGRSPPSCTGRYKAQASPKDCITSSKQRHSLCAKKKIIPRPSAGAVPGGDFIQHNLGRQAWSFKASRISPA